MYMCSRNEVKVHGLAPTTTFLTLNNISKRQYAVKSELYSYNNEGYVLMKLT